MKLIIKRKSSSIFRRYIVSLALLLVSLLLPGVMMGQLTGLTLNNGYYEIGSADDWVVFANYVNNNHDCSGLKFIITSDFDIPDPGSTTYITSKFSGTLTAQAKADGTFPIVRSVIHPLFTELGSAIVSNIMLRNVAIRNTHKGYVGAICKKANGDTRIFNCGILPPVGNESAYLASGGTIGTQGQSGYEPSYCGGLVGFLDEYARVINCFSYANITAGNVVAGIVGYNNKATTQGNNQTNFNNNVKTMVVNCMFYGDITGGTTKRPVYGGVAIANNAEHKVNNYNYYLEENASFDDNYSAIGNYNYSWPIAKKYLTRFEVYRNILNSNRRLCTWWVNGVYNTPPSDADVDSVGIAKWVLDPTIAPYPILKKWGKYYSTFDMDPNNVYHSSTGVTQSRSTANAWEGKSNGTLEVTVKAGSNNSTASDVVKNITITDMDTLGYDYCSKKIQLPYYNEIFGNPEGATWAAKYGNNYTSKVVTGWKITKVNGSSFGTGAYIADWERGYNYADRSSTKKDLYSESKRVFAQGGYYYIPDGVTSIEIEAYWGNAVYLCNQDSVLDRVKNGDYKFYISGTLSFGSNSGILPLWPTSTGGNTVKNKLSDALGQLSIMSSGTVYDQAIVLVSNYQDNAFHGDIKLSGNEYNTKAKPFTIMSADFDFDNEPDFCFQGGMNNGPRINCQPIRFDFLMVPDITMAIRANDYYYGMRVWAPQGHFEITETSYMYTTQFEYDERKENEYKKHEAPLILNGGEHMQIVSSENFAEANQNATATSRVDATSYILMGGKVYMKAFTPGCHGNKRIGTRHCAVNAIGGEYLEFYLSGMFRSDFYNMTDNPHAYLDGGKFGIVAGAGMESVGALNETNGGNVTFMINHSWIKEFYGGGINANRPVTGGIYVTCNNSIVHKYCGGPKVGDMNSNKNIQNRATGTIFGKFFGGGNGGTNNERRRIYDSNGPVDAPTEANRQTAWAGACGFQNFNPFRYYNGYETEFEFELLPDTRGSKKVVKRTYSYWATFAKTIVAPITNTITDCIFKENFYGGGNLGAVAGNVTSTLSGNTVVSGSVFGAGFSASIPSFKVHDPSTVDYPYRDFAGFIHDGSLQFDPREYTWIHDIPTDWNISPTPSTSNPTFQHDGKWYVYCPVELTGLGAVSGNVTLTIEGNTTIGHFENNHIVGGNVYGGGDESAVNGATTVNIQGQTEVLGNVFGGGNKGVVSGSTTVNIQTQTQP